jgi:hypothetical protein
VQGEGVAALLNLALNDANVALLVAAGARDVVAEAQRRHASLCAEECLLMISAARE